MKSKKFSFKKRHSKKQTNESEIPMKSTLFGDYVVYEKIENQKKEDEKIEKNEQIKEEIDPKTGSKFFGDWLIYMNDPENNEKNISTTRKTTSRFSDFFKKILESKKENDSEKKNETEIGSLSTKSGTPDLLRSTFDDSQNISEQKTSVGSNGTFSEKRDSSISNNSINFINQNENLGDSNDKIMDLSLDINKVISLEDKRATIMIKNIPNKFNRDLLLNIINNNFRGTFDLFILPTDINKFKNFGYAFINFTSNYYIPYFYFMFNGKMWSRTNSQKVCELTYSKVQGKENLLAHYPSKIIYLNEEAKNVTPDQKYIIPNDYKLIFHKFFQNQTIEEYKLYFLTKLPKKE